MKKVITAKLKSKKGKKINKDTFEYFNLLYGPEYAKLMVAKQEAQMKTSNYKPRSNDDGLR